MKSDLQRGPGEDRNQQDSEPSRRSGRRRHPGDTRIPRRVADLGATLQMRVVTSGAQLSAPLGLGMRRRLQPLRRVV